MKDISGKRIPRISAYEARFLSFFKIEWKTAKKDAEKLKILRLFVIHEEKKYITQKMRTKLLKKIDKRIKRA